MIITMTGVPCSGKSSVVNYLKEKYDFKVISISKIFRERASELGVDALKLNQMIQEGKMDQSLDKQMDELSVKLGKEYDGQRVIFDSRLAWHFVPNSFKVYILVSPEVMLERLKNSDRAENEKNAVSSLGNSLLERYNLENVRFKEMYGVDHKNLSNYDFVIDNSSLTIEETAEKIYEEYLKFVNK